MGAVGEKAQWATANTLSVPGPPSGPGWPFPKAMPKSLQAAVDVYTAAVESNRENQQYPLFTQEETGTQRGNELVPHVRAGTRDFLSFPTTSADGILYEVNARPRVPRWGRKL